MFSCYRVLRKVFGLLVLLLIAKGTHAQSSDFARLSVSTQLVGDISQKGADVQSALQSKLSNMLSKSGFLANNSSNNRFVLAASVLEESKDISSSTPTMYSFVLSVNLKFGDGISGIVYNSTSLTVKGLESTETKSYLAAIRSLIVDKKEVKEFLELSKTKVVEYYTSQCELIISKSLNLASQNKFDEALYALTEIPDVNQACFEKASKTTLDVYKRKLDSECKSTIALLNNDIAAKSYDSALERLRLITPEVSCYADVEKLQNKLLDLICADQLAAAKVAWAAHDFVKASESLSRISSSASCAANADALIKEIKTYMAEKEKRDWNFELKKYQDQQQNRRDAIKAARDIGVAYGRNQPKVVYKLGWF